MSEYTRLISNSEFAYRQAAEVRRVYETQGYLPAYRRARSFSQSRQSAHKAVRNAMTAKPPHWRGVSFIGYSHSRGNHLVI